MKINFVLLIIFCWSNGYGQQNLFNIPSGDITPKKKLFFQQQVNAYSPKQYESKSHLVYGLIKNVDIGVNFINLPVTLSKGFPLKQNDNPLNGPLYPALLLTGQGQFKISEHIRINLGFMAGSNITSRMDRIKPLYKLYGITNIKVSEHIRILVGPYYSNNFLVGNKNNFGALFGYEIILSKKFYLMGDYISRRNASSAAVVGLNYNLTKRIQFCTGFLLATPQKEIKPGIVFELNILGYDIVH